MYLKLPLFPVFFAASPIRAFLAPCVPLITFPRSGFCKRSFCKACNVSIVVKSCNCLVKRTVSVKANHSKLGSITKETIPLSRMISKFYFQNCMRIKMKNSLQFRNKGREGRNRTCATPLVKVSNILRLLPRGDSTTELLPQNLCYLFICIFYSKLMYGEMLKFFDNCFGVFMLIFS